MCNPWDDHFTKTQAKNRNPRNLGVLKECRETRVLVYCEWEFKNLAATVENSTATPKKKNK